MSKRGFSKILVEYKFIILGLIFFALIAYNQGAGKIAAVFNAIMILLLINIISKCRFGILLLVILSVFICTDIFFLTQYHSIIPVGIIASIFETSLQETFSMFKTFGIPLLIALIIVFLFNYLVYNDCKKKLLNKTWSLFALLLTFIGFWFLLIVKENKNLKNSIQEDYINGSLLSFHGYLSANFPLFYNDLASIALYKSEMVKINTYIELPKKLPDVLSIDTLMNENPSVIYVVLGESSNREHYSLYGYDIPTTPFLKSLAEREDSILCYYRGVSPAPITMEAVRLSLTFATPSNLNVFYSEKSILDLATDRGYETLWISSQNEVGGYVGCIAGGAQQQYYSRSVLINDLNLLPVIKEKRKSDKKQFFVIHLEGSHTTYSDRYDNGDICILNDDKIVQDYDRTIHHTDRFLKGLFDFVTASDQNALIYFYSDHGEDTGPNIWGHGHLHGTIAEFKVPLVAINYKTDIQPKNIIDKYVDKELGYVNTVSLINILAESLGYSVSSQYVEDILEEGKYVYHVDNKVYKVSDLINK